MLLTEWDEPVLTDFGIAGGGGSDGPVHQGVSVPFAAPEVLNRSTDGDERAGVSSLGATIYAVLAGRSPFHTGAPMADAELLRRILHEPVPPTGRSDVPPQLEAVLAAALARDPARRYESALRSREPFQGVELELGLAQTALRVGGAATAQPVRRRRQRRDHTDHDAGQ